MPAPASQDSLTIPRPPEVPPARRFPLVATTAPIIASAVIYAITKSPYTLVFALLGPVVAVASTADAALHRRSTKRREAARFAQELATARLEIDAVHVEERAELEQLTPCAIELCARPVSWGVTPTDPSALSVRVGVGESQSRLANRSRTVAGAADRLELDALLAHAGTVADVPITVHAAHGIGISGAAAPAMALARGILLQLAARCFPDTLRFACPPDNDWDWLGGLPHVVERSAQPGTVTASAAGFSIRLALVQQRAGLPQGIGTVLELEPDWVLRIDETGKSAFTCRADFVSAEQAGSSALELRASARLAGFGGSPTDAIPDDVPFATQAHAGGSAGLAAVIGVAADGPLVVDLRADGPHAVIGGTTGSGKSELLVTWVLAMAAERSPEHVSFLFVDFKGGAAFDPLLALPHCVGVITDLDAEQSLRALVSLGAELRRREKLLATLGLRSIDDHPDGPAFPRLVVVVDEYAALLETHSSLHTVFADIAARGRSLGVHLVLCTQRPAGVVRDSILANCALRLSLRVMSAADSTAVIGTDVASLLPSRPVGRALVSIAGEPARMFQVARSDPGDSLEIVERWRESARPRAPWLAPLPSMIELPRGEDPAEPNDFAFGLADLPQQQAQHPARYLPRQHGSMLVIGAAGSGKTGVLETLATVRSTTRAVRLPKALPQLWDALRRERAHHPAFDRLLLLDDLDAIVASCDDNYRAALLDQVAELLRDGGADGIRLVITVQRVTGALQSALALCGSLLLLRMPNRQEHVLAGGSAADFTEALGPGGGHWRGNRVQVYSTPALPEEVVPMAVREVDPRVAAFTVVSTRPERFAQELRRMAPLRRVVVLGAARFGAGMGASGDDGVEVSLGGLPDILVADPESWQTQWTLLGTLQRSADVLYDGCSLSELRTITRSRELPPPFPRGERSLWLRTADAEVVRARVVGAETPV